jgi:glutamate N-acetyltransferase/amino-acid N-acetyltransferase
LTLGGRRVRIGGCAKGAGMIHPSMATLLVFVTTDAAIAKPVVRQLLTRANELSFHRITIDGDTSTSDTLVLMANGASGAPEISKPGGSAYDAFLEKLTDVCQSLAKQVVSDGEGATKFIAVRVTGAASEKQAGRVAMAIGKSSLVKTAIFGEDANWGRILCAAGYAGVPLSVERVKLRIGGQLIFHNGRLAEDRWEEKVAPKLKLRDITIHLDLGAGTASAEVWTCDLSYDYVKINAHYRT